MRSALAALVVAVAPAFAVPLFAVPLFADTREVIADVILPGYEKFASAARALDMAAQAECDPAALRQPFNAAFDAWMAVSFIHMGPTEEEGRAMAIRFWPDPKGLGAKAQIALLKGDPADLEPEIFAKQSVAARGLSGLERLLYPAQPPAADPCPLIRATTADLARLAVEVEAGWQGESGFAAGLADAGSDGNSRYLSPAEARQALFTQLMGGLEFIADQRLGRPLGDADRPRPERAEAKASGRAARNILLELQAIRRFAHAMEPGAVDTMAALDRAIAAAGRLDEPEMAGVADPARREAILLLQRYVRAARAVALSEMAPALGVGLGFNAQDGD